MFYTDFSSRNYLLGQSSKPCLALYNDISRSKIKSVPVVKKLFEYNILLVYEGPVCASYRWQIHKIILVLGQNES